MANPFGDYDEAEYSKVNVSKCSPEGYNPFDDDDDEGGDDGGDVEDVEDDGVAEHVAEGGQGDSCDAPRIKQFRIVEGGLEKEGLLCPVCMVEFRTVTELSRHFEQLHHASDRFTTSTTSTTGKASDHIKDFLQKLVIKAKDASKDSMNSNSNSNCSPNTSLDTSARWNSSSARSTQNATVDDPVAQWKHRMRPGPRRSHFDEFRRVRQLRIDRSVFESNKLLIRLSKLLANLPPASDTARRRQHEQSVVEWADEAHVPLCPFCACKFNPFTRGRHHCRLCGAVVCTKCCTFVPVHEAIRLTTSVTNATAAVNTASPTPAQPRLSTTSAQSILSIVTGQPEEVDRFRTCPDCQHQVHQRLTKVRSAETTYPVVEHYERLRGLMAEMDQLCPRYGQMARSLNQGESTYSLRDARELKHQVTQLGSRIDQITRRIETLGLDGEVAVEGGGGEEARPNPRLVSLQMSIRRATIAYLREVLVLPELPDEQQLKVLQQRRQEEVQRRAWLDKEAVLEEQLRFGQISVQEPERFELQDDGFHLQLDASLTLLAEVEDPILQQIEIIRTYIGAAQAGNRWDEVRTLQENLKELESEYYFQQQITGNTYPPSSAAASSSMSLSALSLHKATEMETAATPTRPVLTGYNRNKNSPSKSNSRTNSQSSSSSSRSSNSNSNSIASWRQNSSSTAAGMITTRRLREASPSHQNATSTNPFGDFDDEE